ncbi:MAG: PQQ-binding-like beta-propeller repeat protein [Thermoplasmata archaeon]|nr:MAG: PQQ-binding-like beta-propeller repeat protein [Thermoplasmata archaeon]
MIFLPSISPISSEGDSEINVSVMIDFGNGIVEWSDVSLDSNRTALKTTEKACEQLGFDLNLEWFSFGAFVKGIGGVDSPDDWSWFWSFLLWNNSMAEWEGASEGASSLELQEGEIIGWCPSSSEPMTDSNDRYAWAGFRHDSLNLGYTKSQGPDTNAVSWIYDTGVIEMAASPAIAHNKVVINNYGGVFCLNDEGELLWKNEEVVGGFSPAIADELVYVGGKDGYLYCLNFTNGEIIWSTLITSNPGQSGVTSSPTVDKNRIYVGAFNFNGGFGALLCLDTEGGQVIWESPIFSSIYFSSPCVTKDKVYVGLMGLYNSSTLKWKEPYGVSCLDKEHGDELWYFPVNGSVGSSPVVLDSKVLFTSKDGYLYCLKAENGILLWKKYIGSSVSSPAVSGDKIFVGSGEMSLEGKFYCLDLNENILWEFIPNGAVQSSPALAGDCVYFSTNVQNGTIYCLNRHKGLLVWQYRPLPEQYIISSPSVVNGKLYIGSDNGILYCLGGNPTNVTVGETGSTKTIHVGEDVKLLHKGAEYILTITNFDANTVTLEIDSYAQPIQIEVGETKKLDIDGNGKNDLAITINSVDTSSQTVSLTLTAEDEPQDDSLYLLYVLIIIIVVIIIILSIVVIKKRRK